MIRALFVAALTLWGVALLPLSRPAGLDETAWLVYARHLGLKQRVMLLATVATMLLFFAAILAMGGAADGDLMRLRQPCVETYNGHAMCWQMMPTGEWGWREP